MDPVLPKRLASYIHDTGVRALDHLASGVQPAPEGEAPDALQTLVARWSDMSSEEKETFVARVSSSVGEVIAASALLPLGIEVGKKAAKGVRKVLKQSTKALKKQAKAAKKNLKKKAKAAKSSSKKKAKPAKAKKAVKKAAPAKKKSKGRKAKPAA
jgi:hypothetical protein